MDRAEKFLPLIKSIAKKFSLPPSNVIEQADLINAGFVGLLEAAAVYDENAGTAFPSFAWKKIRGRITECVVGGQYLKAGFLADKKRYEKAKDELKKRTGRTPTREETAAYLGWGKGRAMKFCAGTDENDIRLDAFGDDILYSAADTPDEALEKKLLRQTVKETLTEKEYAVIRLYFGEGLKLKAIGNKLGVTEARSSQILKKALAKLRNRFLREGHYWNCACEKPVLAEIKNN